MDLNNIEALINEHGIPSSDDDIIRIARETRGVDVTEIVRPVQTATRRAGANQSTIRMPHYPTNWNANRIGDAYASYRSARNWSAAEWDHRGGIISIFRSSSPIGPIARRAHNANVYVGQNVNGWARRAGIADDDGMLAFPCPIVVDQNTRVDWEPTLIGEQDHVRIQAVMPTAISGPSTLQRMQSMIYSLPIYDPAHTVAELEVNGWIPVYSDHEHPKLIGAILPEAVDPNGRQAMLLGFNRLNSHYYNTTRQLCELISRIASRWTATTTEVDPTPVQRDPSEEDREFVRQMQMVRSFATTMSQRLITLQQSLVNRRSAIDAARTQLANGMRAMDEEAQEIELLNTNMAGRVAERIRSMAGLADQVGPLRQVEEAELDSSGSNLVLKMRTNFFGMKPNDRPAILIPRITYEIDLMATSFDRGVKIKCGDLEYGGNGRIHPHLSGVIGNEYSVCWGNAGREPLPEAWARRDWMSFVRLILSFHTQYNRHSPLTSYNSVRDNLRRAPRSGWITLEELTELDELNAATPNVNEATVDLVGAASESNPF